MLPSERYDLMADISQTLRDLDEAILLVKQEATVKGLNPHKMQLPDGSYILHPLLVGKASALNALTSLKKG